MAKLSLAYLRLENPKGTSRRAKAHGISVGLAITVTVLLSTSTFTEIVGPFATKYATMKAEENQF